MALTIFPKLPGQGWSVIKRPKFSTRVVPHVSGREVRIPLYAHALYEFELLFDSLDGDGSSSALQANSLQTLMGLYASCQGQQGTFLYLDPTDRYTTECEFGVGDGATTDFALFRSIGAAYEPVSYVVSPTSLQASDTANYLPNNLVRNSTNIGAVVGGITPPTRWGYVSPAGVTLTTSAVGTDSSGLPYIDVRAFGTPSVSGNVVVYYESAVGISALQGENFWLSQHLSIVGGTPANTTNWRVGANEFASGSVLLQGDAVTVAVPGASSTLAAAPLTAVDASCVNYRPYVAFNVTNSASVDVTLRIAGVQFEKVSNFVTQPAPRPFCPTYNSSTGYFGAPQVQVNGVGQNPSLYSIVAPNIVHFATAPAAGAVLTWTGTYGFQCRFSDDSVDFENFMQGLWAVQGLKFRQIR